MMQTVQTSKWKRSHAVPSHAESPVAPRLQGCAPTARVKSYHPSVGAAEIASKTGASAKGEAMHDVAIELAKRGFWVFPVVANSKLPAVKDWQNFATNDPREVKARHKPNTNVGIYTGRFGGNRALVVIDIDNKKGKKGDETILKLELEGYEFPPTMEQITPSGGRHLIYVVDEALKQGTNVLGEGVDIRSRGGYIVGPSSTLEGKSYTLTRKTMPTDAPAWLVDRLGVDRRVIRLDNTGVGVADRTKSVARAVAYLATAPVAVEGNGGDDLTFKVASKLKDLGCDADTNLEVLAEHWNPRCNPPWGLADLKTKVNNAYQHGREPVGVSAPEAIFPPVETVEGEEEAPDPVDVINTQHSFIKAGSFVLQETTDKNGRFSTVRLAPNEMHAWFANKTMSSGNKQVPRSKVWMESPKRREYDAVVFSPQKDEGPRWYNLWRGFSVEPAKTSEHPAVSAFLEHALHNVCGGDRGHFEWLMGFFAHMVQKPWEKPLVALVFHGKKGVGKNALVERVGKLFGPHFMVADDDRYLLGNFNSHLESNIFFVLDEASWAGDKRAEGKLKGLITGTEHTIERKGAEPYRVDNLTRVAIIGNEKWLVPTSTDERRFAVFAVNDNRRQDRDFFLAMREGMEAGGYACLLKYLLDYDLTGIDVNAAPQTKGLMEQKHASLDVVEEWWHDCLTSDQLHGSGFDGAIPPFIPKNRVVDAFKRWADTRNIRSRLPSRNAIYERLHVVAPDMLSIKRKPDHAQDATYAYANPGIETLRDNWEKFVGGNIKWEQEENHE